MKKYTVTAYIEKDNESGLYVGIVPGLTGAHTQGATLDELRQNLQEVVELCLEEKREAKKEIPNFVGLQTIEVSA